MKTKPRQNHAPFTTSRRRFLGDVGRAGFGGCVGIGGCGVLGLFPGLNPVSAQDAKLEPNTVVFSPDIEPLVRLLEETPRAKLMQTVTERIRQGLSYQQLVTALLLAGVRNVQPRPHVGFKFHAVLVVNSAHLASLASPDADRWLPILWAVDYFKHSQEQDIEEGNWTMQALDPARLPPISQARRRFITAMDTWDEEGVDPAVAAWVRSAGTNEIFELLFRYGARDLRDIGHKTIFVANSYRTLQCIGHEHAEPVLRSLAYALLAHSDEPNPAENDLPLDAPWRHHQTCIAEFREDWLDGTTKTDDTQRVLQALRSAPYQEVSKVALAASRAGASPQAIWDAIFMAGGELVMKQPGIVALHSLTSANALHFTFRTAANEETRKLILLQALAFITHFRDRLSKSESASGNLIEQLSEHSDPTSSPQSPVEIFASLRGSPLTSAQKACHYLTSGGDPQGLIQEARRLVFLKGTDSHDYKLSSAVLEDYYHLSDVFRAPFLAAATYMLHGADESDNPLVESIRGMRS